MVHEVFVELNRVPPSLNKYLHMHWRSRRKLQKAFDMQVFAEWINQGKFVFTNPVKLTFLFCFPRKRCRDRDNYIGGTKPIIDALKRTFIFRDDAEWIKDIQVRFSTGKERTIILIEEMV